MRTIVESITDNDFYKSAFKSLENKIRTEIKDKNIPNSIVSYEDLIHNTSELLHDNFLTTSMETNLENVDINYNVHSIEDFQSDNDAKIDSIYAFADKTIPAYTTESIYESPAERLDEVNGLSKVIAHTLIQYTNKTSFSDFNNLGRDDGVSGLEGMKFAYGSVLNDAVGSLESYGITEQNHHADMRAAVLINTNNYLSGLVDRLVERVSTPTAKTLFKSVNVVKFDYAKGKDTSATVRDSDRELSYIELNKDPTSINTKSMPVTFKDSSDDHTFQNGKLLKINNEFNIFDITRDVTKVGYDHVGESDRLSEGGKIKNIYVEITTAANTSRVYKVNVRFNDGSWFTKAENMKEGSDRVVSIKLKNHPIVTADAIAEHRGSAQAAGDTDQLEDITGDQAIYISGTISGNLNLRTSIIEVVSGALTWDVVDTATGKTTVDTAGIAVKGEIASSAGKIEVVAYDIDLQFTEENIRKATVGVRTNVVTKAAKVPHGKTYIFETQALPNQTGLETLIDTSKNIIGLGNADKALTIIEDFIDNGIEALKVEKMQPNSTAYDNFNSNFVSSNKILPSIREKTVDFSSFANRRELEKTHDAYGLLERELKSLTSKMDEESGYSTVLSTGEKMRFVAVTHNRIINTIISPMTPNAVSEKPMRSGMHKASIQISQSVIIEFHGVSFNSYKNKMVMFPIRQANRGDTTSFGVNLDVGTYLGNFISGDSAVSKKHIINSREILFITTPVAAKITFSNINDVYPDIV